MNLGVTCQCACSPNGNGPPLLERDPAGHSRPEPEAVPSQRVGDVWDQRERGVVTYAGGLHLRLAGPPLRQGEVLHLLPEDTTSFELVTMSLYANGFSIKAANRKAECISWSPFSLVQACRLHSVEADAQMPWLRLMKVSVFAHGATHFFATQGDTADADRARWVADIARSIRVLTLSLFPSFELCADPVPGAAWTSTRLLAGYLLLSEEDGVSLLYCELHAQMDGAAAFAAYEDECCDVAVMRLSVDVQTCVSERVGVDCSCFSIDGRLLSTRTCSEKMLWLRAVSNVKVKLRHNADNPSGEELQHYRSAVLESARTVRQDDDCLTRAPLLPRRPLTRRPGSGMRATPSPMPPSLLNALPVVGHLPPVDGPLKGALVSSSPTGPRAPPPRAPLLESSTDEPGGGPPSRED